MKRRLLKVLLSLAVLLPAGASAMQQSAVPPKFSIPWGNQAGSAYIRSIPSNSQIGIQNCAASLTDGFPPLTFVPSVAGGCPPFGQDFNGILKQITQWSQWYSGGAPIFYDSAFATGAANGYANGAVVQSTIVPGDFWLSTADNNATNPDAGGANWVPLPSSFQTGSVSWTWTTAIPSGWVISAPNTTIGNASSGATLASPTTQFLYAQLWTYCSNSLCPVTGGRGANAAADYAANKPMQVLNLASSLLIGNDAASGVLAGVPTISGGGVNSNTSIVGEVLHALTTAQLPAHTHNYSGNTGTESAPHTHNINGGANFQVGNASGGLAAGGINSLLGPTIISGVSTNESATHSHAYSGTTDGCSACAATAGNNTPRSMVGYWMIKL